MKGESAITTAACRQKPLLLAYSSAIGSTGVLLGGSQGRNALNSMHGQLLQGDATGSIELCRGCMERINLRKI